MRKTVFFLLIMGLLLSNAVIVHGDNEEMNRGDVSVIIDNGIKKGLLETELPKNTEAYNGNQELNQYMDEQYIVYLKQPLLMSADQNENRDYIVVSEEKLNNLLRNDLVEFYEPDVEIKLFDDFTSSTSGMKWNLTNINVSKAWNIGCYGNYVKVGVIDSGVYAHEDLKNNLLTGHNYITGTSDTTDNIGHGTFVSGIIAAEANGEYIDGIANRAKLVPLKCFDNGASTKASMIADAIYDAIDIYDCDVINMSFGMTEASTNKTLQLAIKYAQNKGCILVAAVGNSGSSTVYYPAKYDGVVGVGAVNSSNSICSFSQRNTTVDVVAPGSGLESVSIPSFTNNSGTSFSAPHVSAMAAIAKCIDEDVTSSEFNTLLQETSTDLGTVGYDTRYGYGLINVEAMVDKMLENTEYFISPISEDDDEISVTVYNNSSVDLSVKEITGIYSETRLVNTEINDANILKGETKVFQTKKQDNVKFMLWNGFDTLKPLTKSRQILNNITLE